ncbi:MAG: hypothetical protein AB9903_26565 [Vulcanimicrobiota bacterium]
MKKLLIVPILHSEVDMGSMKDTMKEEYIRQYGIARWNEHVSLIRELWNEIRKRLFGINLDYGSVHVYQDGLPLCGKEHEIVRDIVNKGSDNYRIVQDLVQKGAHLEGTEDPKLLLKELSCLKNYTALDAVEKNKEVLNTFEHELELIMKERDQYIAARIAGTLGEGESGILFIGLKHNVPQWLPKDISFTHLSLDDTRIL